MFKIGDRVICISAYPGSKLTLNKKYTIKNIHKSKSSNIYVTIFEISGLYGAERLILDVKEQRKEKLLKIEKLCF